MCNVYLLMCEKLGPQRNRMNVIQLVRQHTDTRREREKEGETLPRGREE